MRPIEGCGISYVMSTSITGRGTRSPVKGGRYLKDDRNLKGAAKVKPVGAGPSCHHTQGVRPYSSSASGPDLRDEVSTHLTNLPKLSINDDMEGINRAVKALLNNPYFYLYCYEAIKSNPGSMARGGSLTPTPPETLDGID